MSSNWPLPGHRDWGRVLTAMLTPFGSDGSVNFAEAARVARWLVDEQGNDGIVVNGTTGESPTLTEAEKLELLTVVLAEVGDRAAIIFGAGTYNTAESVHLAQAAQRQGAHGVMAVNPYYNRPGQSGLYAHFRAIAESVELPVMLYNIQPRSAINLETPTLLRLAEISNIVAVKEASGNLSQIQDVCRQMPTGFRLYSGDDGLTLPMLSVGAHGVVSVAGHIVGREIGEMVAAFETNPARARELHHQLLPIYGALFAYPSPVPVKYALSRRGFACESVRLPLVPLTDDEKSRIDPVLNG
ncbi:MAG: 4-hydroxy-tetrahydrodipicolinate synthase [Fimbriimonadaceae bacterium]|nr:4-hydroxy-tetrahydrodipicolinate synthase [Fimbriimonadaceae bacterium]